MSLGRSCLHILSSQRDLDRMDVLDVEVIPSDRAKDAAISSPSGSKSVSISSTSRALPDCLNRRARS